MSDQLEPSCKYSKPLDMTSCNQFDQLEGQRNRAQMSLKKYHYLLIVQRNFYKTIKQDDPEALRAPGTRL